MEYKYELYHHGVKGMKWGVRKVRGHAGPGKYLTKNRQLAGDKRDLEGLSKGRHLSVGLTKKRQAAFDARDKALLEKRIGKNESTENTALRNRQFREDVKYVKKNLSGSTVDFYNKRASEKGKDYNRAVTEKYLSATVTVAGAAAAAVAIAHLIS